MAKGIENRARSPPAVFDFATSQNSKNTEERKCITTWLKAEKELKP